MSKQARIREELKEAERKANLYAREMQAAKHESEFWYRTMRERYVHYQMRRSFFVKALLKAQLKEFDYG